MSSQVVYVKIKMGSIHRDFFEDITDTIKFAGFVKKIVGSILEATIPKLWIRVLCKHDNNRRFWLGF